MGLISPEPQNVLPNTVDETAFLGALNASDFSRLPRRKRNHQTCTRDDQLVRSKRDGESAGGRRWTRLRVCTRHKDPVSQRGKCSALERYTQNKTAQPHLLRLPLLRTFREQSRRRSFALMRQEQGFELRHEIKTRGEIFA